MRLASKRSCSAPRRSWATIDTRMINCALLKRWVFGAAEAGQLNALSRRLHGRSIAVLCYHGVVEEDRSADRALYGNTVNIRESGSQLDYLAKRFTPISGADEILLRVLDWPESTLNTPAGSFRLPGSAAWSERFRVARDTSQACKRVPAESSDEFLFSKVSGLCALLGRGR